MSETHRTGETPHRTGETPHPDRDGRRRGRRAGSPDTRGEIARVARDAFTARGYTATTMRGVARAAGVDPALVHHYFGDKTGLFLAAAQVSLDPRRIMQHVTSGGRERFGERLLGAALPLWESVLGGSLVATLRDEPRLIPAFAAMISQEIVEVALRSLDPLPAALHERRVARVEVIMGGLFMTRYNARMEPVASFSRRQVIDAFAPLLQAAIEDDPGSLGRR